MPLQFVKSQKGHKLLLVEGILYCKKKINKNNISWRCSSSAKCNVIIHTDNELKTGNIVGPVPNHNHPADISGVKSKIIKEKIKKKAARTEEKSATIIAGALRGVLSPVAAVLPKPSSLQRSVQRARHDGTSAIVNPSIRGELTLVDEFKITHQGDCCLVHDSGGNKKRFIVFSTIRNLNYLSECSQWLGDGTFRSAPAIFTQLYTIHGLKDNKSLPLVYLLAPSKSKGLYTNFLKILRARLPNFTPERMMVDFEQGFIDAFKECYSGATISGCNFHFTQCVFRHVQSCGLQRNYNTDVEFSTNIRLLMALAFVPVGDVVAAYDDIVACPFYDRNSDLLNSLLNYFELTWIGPQKHNKKNRAKPLFPLKLWNCYNLVINNYIRSNNMTEGWHSGFNNLVGVANPSFGAFMGSLKDEQSKTEVAIIQMRSGLQVAARRRKAYLDRDSRIKNIVMNYDGGKKLDYLKSLAKVMRF